MENKILEGYQMLRKCFRFYVFLSFLLVNSLSYSVVVSIAENTYGSSYYQNVSSEGIVGHTIELDNPATTQIIIPLDFSGTAVRNVDYSISSEQIVFEVGEQSKTLLITLIYNPPPLPEIGFPPKTLITSINTVPAGVTIDPLKSNASITFYKNNFSDNYPSNKSIGVLNPGALFTTFLYDMFEYDHLDSITD